MSTDPTFVIVGAGLTGATAAQTLREEGFDGPIVVIGAEQERPYERPPLSKGYLAGTQERNALAVHDAAWYAENEVELLLGHRVHVVDPAAHQVQLGGGDSLGYSKLLLATGAAPRRLDCPGAELEGLHYLRSVDDSERLRAALRGGGPVVVVGAGWIGLETAAAARGYGCEVTLLDPQVTPLHAALGPEMGTFFADVHRRHGVELRLGVGVTAFRGTSRIRAVVTETGDEIPADIVIVGIGARPVVEPIERAGLPVDNGVLVDHALRTEDPDVYAAGDVANAMHPRYGRPIRVEHWANARASGAAAARSMLGRAVVEDAIPYFFTDQYDIGMEFAGWFPPGGYDNVVTRGDIDSGAFQAFWLAGHRVVAGMHVNRWDEGIAPIKELIHAGVPVDSQQIADESIPLPESPITRSAAPEQPAS
jgi:3-phenylpropionate/trans-cinnamate dioxygenase ferredoxin reductase subunit